VKKLALLAWSTETSDVAARSQALDDGIVVVGASSYPLRDAYHSILRMSWPAALGVIALLFLVANAIFGIAYTLTGGVTGAHDGSFRDAFFFSVQTMGTVGYGAMYPTSTAANVLVVAESVVSVIVTALATGIVFARFSQSSGRLVFTSHICIAPMDGVPTVLLRVGNDGASTIFEATIRLVFTKTDRTQEGVVFYRLFDMTLTRDRSPALSRSWTVMHPIDEKSPLHGLTPGTCAEKEVEIVASIVGTDDTSLQPVHARHRYEAKDMLWGSRPADILSELADGRLQLDVRKFDETVQSQPTEAFPYPKAP
jgi:inward rectifier potassium channel